MDEGPGDGLAPGGQSSAGAQVRTWPALDAALPWLMVAFAPLAFAGIPLTKPWDGLRVAAFLTALVLVWSALAVTAVVLALRHAKATRDLARYAPMRLRG